MGKEGVESPWFEYLTEPRDGFDVHLVNANPDSSELSEYEIGVLDSINEKFGRLNKWNLRDLTHTLPEWKDPNGSSMPIRVETILQVGGKTPEEIERIGSDAREIEFFESLLS